MIVQFDRRASADLESIRTRIALDSLKAAGRMYEELRAACAGLSDFPRQGRAASRSGLRELTTVRPYIIVYTVGATVRIRRIVHGARLR